MQNIRDDEKIQREIFSSNLKYWLKSKGKDQVDIANVTGVSRAAVTSWCNGSKMPTMGKIQAIADYLNILKSDLLEEKNLQERNELEDEFLKLFNQLTDKEKTILTKQIQAFIDSH